MSGGVKRFCGTARTVLEDELPAGLALDTAESDVRAAGNTASDTGGFGAGTAGAELVRTGEGEITRLGPEESGSAPGDTDGGAACNSPEGIRTVGGGEFAGGNDAGRNTPEELRGAGRFASDDPGRVGFPEGWCGAGA